MFGPKKQQISGWLAVGVSTTIACFWAMWGIVENFHEGWFYDSLLANLAKWEPQTSYIKLAPEDWVFSTTLLHETGHMLLSMLNGGRQVPKREIASISHTTAALTDRGTAFDEGFAI